MMIVRLFVMDMVMVLFWLRYVSGMIFSPFTPIDAPFIRRMPTSPKHTAAQAQVHHHVLCGDGM
jgi:hypothetical protein